MFTIIVAHLPVSRLLGQISILIHSGSHETEKTTELCLSDHFPVDNYMHDGWDQVLLRLVTPAVCAIDTRMRLPLRNIRETVSRLSRIVSRFS